MPQGETTATWHTTFTGMAATMNVLTIARQFPNDQQPNYGVFVENRIARLAKDGQLSFRVLAPVAWVPFGRRLQGRLARFGRIASQAARAGYIVDHPRYCVIPKLGFPLAPFFLYLGLTRHIRQLMKQGYTFDFIDAHFFFPDGVAAVLLGRRFAKPVVVTARGSDLNHQAELPLIGAMIRWAIRNANWVITVSNALQKRAIALGARPAHVTVLRNGVDLEEFRPLSREPVRAELGLRGTTLLSVGYLFENKGHHLVIEAMRSLPDAELLVVGEGRDRPRLQSLIERWGLKERVRLVGSVPHRELPRFYNAADALVLASSREGSPNVVLEAMACGTPVIATAVGGIPDLVTSSTCGVLIEQRTSAAIVTAVERLFATSPDRSAVRAHAMNFAWDDTISRQTTLFKRLFAPKV